MILTGISKEDFEKWFSDNYGKFETTSFQECASAPLYQVYFDEIDLPKEIENSLIIEFFDEIGIHINIFYKYTWRIEIINFRGNLLSDLDFADFETRQEATIQAIKKSKRFV